MIDARKLLLGLVLCAAAVGSWWLTRGSDVPTTVTNTAAAQLPDYIVENFTGNSMDAQGRRKYLLTARRLTHYPHDDTAHFVEPVLVQFQPGGVIATTRADTGVMPDNGTEIVMTGNVRLTRSGDGEPTGVTTTDRLRVELDR